MATSATWKATWRPWLRRGICTPRSKLIITPDGTNPQPQPRVLVDSTLRDEHDANISQELWDRVHAILRQSQEINEGIDRANGVLGGRRPGPDVLVFDRLRSLSDGRIAVGAKMAAF